MNLQSIGKPACLHLDHIPKILRKKSSIAEYRSPLEEDCSSCCQNMSSSICFSFRSLVPQWRRTNVRFLIFLRSKSTISFSPRVFASLSDEDSVSMPKPAQFGYDPSPELYGLVADTKPRNASSEVPEPRSWFGPSGQYIKELPCPNCRARGYTPCTECGIERSRADCSLCNGKGIMTCQQCSGDRVIWEESIDEIPWEKVCSNSPLQMKEDDEVDNLDIQLEEKKKSKRIYQSLSREVGLKISRSLKSLNAKTGIFSKRMKIIHGDPALQAQRVAAIKKAKGSDAARKKASDALKAFFSDPENRRQRSIAMKGVKFYCKNCGKEGHRRHYCPELGLVSRKFKCRACGQKGHNMRTCKKSRMLEEKLKFRKGKHCRVCGESGHNRRTCPVLVSKSKSKSKLSNQNGNAKLRSCGICRQMGHNRQKCLTKMMINLSEMDVKAIVLKSRRRKYSCGFCGEDMHNVRTCPDRKDKLLTDQSTN